MSAAHHNSYATGFPPSPDRVEPLADCASARAGGHLAPGACAPAAPGVLSEQRAKALREQGMLWKQVAAELGCSIRWAQTLCKRAGAACDPSRWSPEQVATLVNMREAGATAAQIGKALGKKPTAIHSKVKALGIQGSHGGARVPSLPPVVPFNERKRITPDMIERVIAMRSDGMTWRQIAIVEGRTVEAMRVMRTSYDLASRFRFTQAHIAKLVIMHRKGVSQRRMAETLGCSETAVTTRLRWLRRKHPHLLDGTQ